MPIFKFVKEGLGSSEPPCECIRTWVQHASEAYTEMWVCITAPHSSIQLRSCQVRCSFRGSQGLSKEIG